MSRACACLALLDEFGVSAKLARRMRKHMGVASSDSSSTTAPNSSALLTGSQGVSRHAASRIKGSGKIDGCYISRPRGSITNPRELRIARQHQRRAARRHSLQTLIRLEKAIDALRAQIYS